MNRKKFRAAAAAARRRGLAAPPRTAHEAAEGEKDRDHLFETNRDKALQVVAAEALASRCAKTDMVGIILDTTDARARKIALVVCAAANVRLEDHEASMLAQGRAPTIIFAEQREAAAANLVSHNPGIAEGILKMPPDRVSFVAMTSGGSRLFGVPAEHVPDVPS